MRRGMIWKLAALIAAAVSATALLSQDPVSKKFAEKAVDIQQAKYETVLLKATLDAKSAYGEISDAIGLSVQAVITGGPDQEIDVNALAISSDEQLKNARNYLTLAHTALTELADRGYEPELNEEIRRQIVSVGGEPEKAVEQLRTASQAALQSIENLTSEVEASTPWSVYSSILWLHVLSTAVLPLGG